VRATERAALPPLVIGGPTASGKSGVAAELAASAGGAVLCADSRQVVRGLAVGSAQPGAELLRRAPHHLFAFLSPRAAYGAGEYGADARRVLAALAARGAPAVLCGGTGLWLRAAVLGTPPDEGAARPPLAVRRRRREELAARWAREGPQALHAELGRVDPRLAARLHPGDRQRVLRGLEYHAERGRPLSGSWGATAPAVPALRVRLEVPAAELDRRIAARLEAMLAAGLLDEARRLRARYGDDPPAALTAVGYRELFAALRGERSLDDALEDVRLRTRRYAKRQRTWFRRQDAYEPVPGDERAASAILDRWRSTAGAAAVASLRTDGAGAAA
jgi:tRNA dimethylallyltransferase